MNKGTGICYYYLSWPIPPFNFWRWLVVRLQIYLHYYSDMQKNYRYFFVTGLSFFIFSLPTSRRRKNKLSKWYLSLPIWTEFKIFKSSLLYNNLVSLKSRSFSHINLYGPSDSVCMFTRASNPCAFGEENDESYILSCHLSSWVDIAQPSSLVLHNKEALVRLPGLTPWQAAWT